MADVYNPEVAKVVMTGRLNGQNVQNALYFQMEQPPETGWTRVGMEGLVAVVASWLSVDMAPQVSNQFAWQTIAATQLSEDFGIQVIEQLAPDIVGGVNSEALPNNVAAVASIVTGQRGRSGRGRIYIAGLTRGQTEQSYIKGESAVALDAAIAELLPAAAAAGFVLGVYSRWHKKVKRAVGVFTPATGFNLSDGVLDSQRGRLPGRGD